MAKKSYYHRSFIILKAESRGYGFISNKEPTGYCKFEIRRGVGKAYIYIQDIKPSSTLNGVYEAYLVSADESIRPCKLASIHIDEQGRGEHIATFDAEDIKGSGHSLENFHALAIAFRYGIEGRNMRIAYPLIGYSSKQVNIDTHKITQMLKVIHGEGMEIEEEPEPILQAEPGDEVEVESEVEPEDEAEAELEAEIEPKPEDEVEVKSEAEVESEPKVEFESQIEVEAELELEAKVEPEDGVEPEDEVEAELEAEVESELEVEYDPISHIRLEPLVTYPEKPVEPIHRDESPQEELKKSEEDEEELKRAYEDSYREFLEDLSMNEKSYPDRRQTYWDNVKDYFTGLFKAHHRISPFGKELGDAEWVRVQQATTGYNGYYTESPYRYPYFSSSYPDHYIVGLIRKEGEIKYVVYGIPSMYSMIPPISLNGFSRWMPIKNGYGMGYWLLYIDAVSGSVVHPYEKE